MNHIRRYTVVMSIAMAAVSSAVIATSPDQQERDARPTTGTAFIGGTLVAAETGVVVRHARVALTSNELPAALATNTDEQGTFAFSNLPAGTFKLWAAKSGFVTASYGEKRAGAGPGTPIVLADRQRVDQLTFKIARAGVLTGVVLDEFGEPVQGALVRATRYVTVSGRRTSVGGGMGEVDDRGLYRISSLTPGEYLVFVSSSSGPSRMYQAGMAARADGPANSPPPVLFSSRPDLADVPQLDIVATYFPGTTAIWSASLISLSAGEERSGVDIRLRRLPLARVSGTVRDADGSIPRGDVRLTEVSSTATSADFEAPYQSTTLDREGGFSFSGVAPGQYIVAVRHRPADYREQPTTRWAVQDVTVGGVNINGLALTLQGGLTITGTAVADSGVLPQFAGGIVFTPTEDSRFLTELLTLQTGVGADGRFTTHSLAPGRYHVNFRSSLPEWRLSSAVFAGREALDFLLEVKPGDSLTGLLTLTVKETELSGTVFEKANTPTSAFTVVVFSDDQRYWLPGNRRNQAMPTDTKGQFVFRDLPAGTYRLALVDDFDAVAGLDAVLLRQLAISPAVTVTLFDGERKVQDLRIK